MSVLSGLSPEHPPLALALDKARRRRRWVFAATAVLAVALATGAVAVHLYATARTPLMPPPQVDVLRSVSDGRILTVTTTSPTWTKTEELVTVDQLRTDHQLWRRMHFGDWDSVPQWVREPSMQAMIRAYARLFRNPSAWQTMALGDWDAVPQPIRAMAYLRMIWHWAQVEDVGTPFGLRRERMAQTIGAIVMAESWFEHLAVNENQWGNRDLGLAQCSYHCRATIAVMAKEGAIAFAPAEEDYFEPWIATRVATVWFKRELERADGDVELAIRAYHRGIDAAMDEKGDVYLANVLRLRERYIRAGGPSPSWRLLIDHIAKL